MRQHGLQHRLARALPAPEGVDDRPHHGAHALLDGASGIAAQRAATAASVCVISRSANARSSACLSAKYW
jgi:hypothetical protein